MGPMQAFDAGGRARAMATIVEAMSRAKEAGLAPGDLGAALRLVDWSAEGLMLTRATLPARRIKRSEEHTSELQSLMRISYAVFCLKKKNKTKTTHEQTIEKEENN